MTGVCVGPLPFPVCRYSRLISPMLRVKPFTRPRLHALLQSFPTLDECNCLAKVRASLG